MDSHTLEEFERIEQEMKDLEYILTGEIDERRDSFLTNTESSAKDDGTTLIYNDEISKEASKISVLFPKPPDVLNEFEELESACEEIEKIKLKAMEQELILKEENHQDNIALDKSTESSNNELINETTNKKKS